jgi:DNA-binding response OmpR family regulator
MRARILLVEDEAQLAKMLGRGLELDGYGVEIATNGIDGLRLATEESYDLLILDWMLPGMDGITICRRLRDRRSTVPILMLTARDDVPDRVAGLETGADDYLTKPFDFTELKARIAALLRRGRYQRRRILTFGELRVDTEDRTVAYAGEPVPTTPKEYELLALLCTRAGQVVERDYLIARLWPDTETSSNNLEVLVASLRRKLEAEGRPRLLHTAHRRGYRFDDPGDVTE